MTDRERPHPPLPPSDFSQDWLKQWLQTQTLSFQKIITGDLQAGNILESSNFSSGSAGWQIDGDGNAEFNDIVIRGDLVSGNWDGTDPPSLSSEDTGATAGFALDSSEGAAQFEGTVYASDLVILDDGTLTVEAGTGAGVTRLVALGSSGNATLLWELNDDTEKAKIFANSDAEMTLDAVSSIFLQINGATKVNVGTSQTSVNAGGEEKLRVVDSGTALKFDFIARRGNAFVPMEVGGTDSGGSGFRVVRVPN